MAVLKLGQEFTPNEGETPTGPVQPGQPAEEAIPAETETETPPSPPEGEKPADEEIPPSEDTGELSTLQQDSKDQAIQSLQQERVKLLRDIAELRGQRRELKQDQITRVEQAIDELKDVHPEDVTTIEKVLRSKGYIRKDEAQQMYYGSVQNEEINKFLEKYPEYKPENDANDLNWSRLKGELYYQDGSPRYALPKNPHQISEILERAHRAIAPSDRGTPQARRRLEVAGVGGGGVQRSSPSGRTLDPDRRYMLSQGGWSEEEIKKIEAKLE